MLATSVGYAWWIPPAPGIAATVTILLANYMGGLVAGVADPDRLAKRRSIVKGITAMMAGDE